MTALRTVFSRARTILDMMNAAIAVSAAVRSHHLPKRADLQRLGINPTPSAMDALSRA